MFVGLALLRAEGGHQLRRRHGCYRSRYSGTRRAGALLLGDVGYVAMTAAAEVAVMLVVLMLPLAEEVSADSAARLLPYLAQRYSSFWCSSRWSHRLGGDG